ncbi:PH domain-containing protein [Mycobacterium sp. M1]|uniref:PH domain-containing protein n=1 Tax=Mycolicibacter acidiphilus TaxID=2835306 RepID=A0ABS5RJJ5_9MYCO|nr:PH domain-containing protein [Mycolicibacter acidiphilus]MBS9533753.1 PH domain-containing protein [Mycolicibacter acidiphilus]
MTDNPTQQTQWAPRTSGIAGCALAGAVLAITAVTLATDLPGRLLGGVAGVGLLVFAGSSWRARPKLAITADGLVLRGFWRTRVLRPADLRRIRITEFQRLGRKQRLLEIETHDDHLVLLSRWDLGTDPLDVLDALTTAGYAGR